MFLYLDMLLKPHLVMKLEMPCVKYHFSIWKHHLLAKQMCLHSISLISVAYERHEEPTPPQESSRVKVEQR